MRLLVLLAIVVILLWLLKRLISGNPEADRLESSKTENMRQCRYCGVHVPESSVLTVNNEAYCCQEHADLDQR